jgi:hypothetical protein
MLFLVPLFAFGLTVIVDYMLPKMSRRKRIFLLCIAGLFGLAFGTVTIFLMFHSSN